ncbi:MAG: TlpA family protein disulfide reductase [Fimbriimonas sp.]
MTPLLMLLALVPQNDPLVARADAFLQRPAAFSLDYVARLDKRPQAVKGSFRVQGKDRLYFDAIGPGIHYTVSITEKGTFELDCDLKLYETFPWEGQIGFYKSELGMPRQFMAPGLMVRGVSRLAPPKNPFRKVSGGIGGATRLRTEFPVDAGTVRLEMDILPDGRLTQFRREVPGQLATTWTFTNFREIPKPKLADFSVEIPLGFSPFVLPRDRGPVGPGEKLPTGAVRTADGRSVSFASLTSGKRSLVVCLGADCEPSRKLAAALGKLKSAVAGKAALVTLYESSPKGDGVSDPSGKLWNALVLPATPVCFLVDAKGVIERAWMGFDPSSREGVLTEISAALNEKP